MGQSTHSESEIEKLKREILREVKGEKKNKKRHAWNSMAVTGVLAVLVIFSITQTVQSAVIMNKITNGNIKTVGTSVSASASGSSLPSNLQDLPDMVGGC